MNKETSKRAPLSSAYRNSAAVLPWMLCATALIASGPARAGGALPTNGQYVAGQGSITSSAGNVTVNQASSHGIINWQNFSIGQGNSVLFNNGSGATLNRVTGNQISQIDGSLKATGSVYLINPQGIVIGPSGQVIANGSFVASTRDVSNDAFMNGQAFSASGTSNGAIINQGVITSNTGDAILVGSAVTNTGSIFAPNGTVGLAAGNEITLQPAGSDSRIAISGGTGSVTNSGNLKAAQAELNAAGGNVYALVENNGGAISATGTTNVGGHVWLTAGGTGAVTVSGTVNAQNANGSGGDVTVRGYNINLPGTVNAFATTASGNGGNVSVVASNSTTVSGAIHAHGGASGQGGTIETSGHSLSFGGANIDAGKGGNWLLDPYDLTVTSSAATTIDNSLNAGTNVTLQTTASGTSGPGTANASGSGNININAPLSWNTSATLTLNAYASIVFDANVSVQNGGGLVMVTNSGGNGGDYIIDPGDSIQFPNHGSLTINGQAYKLAYSVNDIFNDSQPEGNASTVFGGNIALAMPTNAAGYNLPSSIGYAIHFSSGLEVIPFNGTFTGLGNTISNLSFAFNSSNFPAYEYTALFGWLAGGGVVRNIGLINENMTGGYAGGLVSINQGLIEYSYTTGSVSSAAGFGLFGSAGGLVYNNNGTIVNSYSSTKVNGAYNAGGLAYVNTGTIANSFATGAVSASVAGGLVANNAAGSIVNSFAMGSVTGTDVGGLAGVSSASITDSYATGVVSHSGAGAGGFVGLNSGTITGGYWDTTASGIGNGFGSASNVPAGAAGLTTARFQSGSLPTNLASTTWGAGGGLYPYLKSIFPTGISVITGTVENPSDTAGVPGAMISTDVGGNFYATTTTNASGGFYAFGHPVTVGASGLAYVNGNAATYIPSLAASGASNVVLIGNALTDTTSATLLSQVSHANLVSLFDAAATNDPAALSTIANTQGEALFDSGASFTVDQPIAGTLFVKMSAADAPITVSQPITLFGSDALTLDATGNLTINANVNATGANAVTLTNGAGDSYSLGFGDSIAFTGGSTDGASLAINGNPYALIYSMGQLQAINNALGADYALATRLNAATDPTTPANWTPIAGSQIFTGIFEGLGNTVSNLNASGVNAGLFAVSSGTIRDLGVLGGTFTGSAFAGAIAGQNLGLIEDSYATSTVGGAPDAGGLAGYNTGTLVNDYASGSVSGSNAAGVGGASAVGGLVGYNTSSITLSFATGSAGNAAYAGGLVGENVGGTIGNSFATVAVNGSTNTGGLAGNNTGTIANAYATGDVAGFGRGELVGTGGGAVTDSFWDSNTTGQSGGDTTAQLQGALPGTFSSSFWGTGTGLYPYLKSFFANGIAAVSGTTYSDAGTTALAGATIGVDVNGNFFSSATTGANGYYYAFGAPVAAGANALAYVKGGDAATLGNNLAVTGASGVNIFGNTLSETTSATLLSQLSGNVQSLANGTAANDSAGLAAIAAAPNAALLDTAASFTVDQAWTPSSNLIVQMTSANAPIIVAAPITLAGTHALGLNATGNITFNADVTVTGGGALSFANGTGDSYSLTVGDNIAFTGGAGSGASLAINGVPYTLIYSMGQLQNVNNKVSGDYALATSLNAATDPTTPASWVPLGGSPFIIGGFTGAFEGLGNTISNLTIDTNGADYTGLFGYVSGTIRDVGSIGGSVAGGNYTGGLVGYNIGGSITQSYATGNVSGNNYVGGLVGENFTRSATITLSYATGNVSGHSKVGGLGGYNSGTINETYATGNVSGNTIEGSGGYVGGLVGEGQSSNTISNSFATGNVTGNYAGGFIGATRSGTITDSYSTGSVNGGYHAQFSSAGFGTTNGYYDSQTSGGYAHLNQGAVNGATGLTTAQLQGTLPTGFSSSVWSTGTGLYPYLTALFPNGIAVVKGTTNFGGNVTVDTNGEVFGSTPVAANDTYYIFGQPGSSSLLAYQTGQGLGVAFIGTPVTGANTANFTNGMLAATTSATTYSGLTAAMDAAAGSDAVALAVIANATSFNINATGASFKLDEALTIPGALTINATGSLAFDADVTMTGGGALSFSAGGGNYSFAPGTNVTFTAPEGSGQSLTIDGTGYRLIYSMAELQNINANLNGHYALATSLNAATDPTTPASWTPLGTSTAGGGTILNTNGFAGTFEGLGNTVSNLTVNMGSANNSGAGLFGYSSGTLRDVGLINSSVSGGYEVGALTGVNTSTGTITNSYAAGGAVSGVSNVGGLVGLNQGTVSSSYATDPAAATAQYAGGLVGYSVGVISDSYATGAASGLGSAGGLVGFNNGTISNDYATGAVSATGSYVGGLVGNSGSAGAISKSYATGALSGAGDVGGLAGGNSGTISSSFWNTQTSGKSTAVGLANGGSVSATGLTTAAMTNSANFTGWTFGGLGSGATWVLVDANGTIDNASGATGGTTPMLLSEYATNIVNAHQLQLMALDPTATYTLLANVNAAGTAGGDVWGAQSFVPIGGNNAAAFTGNFNGQNYTISGLTINASTLADVGLFGVNNGTISNVTLTGGSITGSGFVGGLVGWNAGTLTNDAADVAVTETGFGNAGGLVGENLDGAITGSHASGTVTTSFVQTGEGDIVGGLVGENDGTIANSYATGAVSGTMVLAGGLVGFNNLGASIGGSYAIGSVTVSGIGSVPVTYNEAAGLSAELNANEAGGLVGQNGGDVNTSQASGTVSGATGTGTGGFVGRNVSGGTIETSSATGTVSGASEVGGFAGWNDGTITGSNAWTVSVSGTGYGVGGFVGYNTSTGDIEQSGVSGNNAAGTLTSLGTVSEISGLGGAGGFAGTNAASLSNDTVTQLAVGSASVGTVGGFVGQNTASGTIADSSVTDTTTTGLDYVGGFVGGNAGQITGSTATTMTAANTHAISGRNQIGGFAGDNTAGGVISGSSSTETVANAATLNATGNRVGGFVGWNAGSLTGDQTSDAVKGLAQVGGFVGWNDGSITDGTAQTVSVTGTQYGVGGFVGYNTTAGDIETSSVTQGTVGGIGGVGGFAGMNTGSLSNADSVTGLTINDSTASTTGGFAAQNTGTITGATVASTTVNGANYTGGFAGTNSGSISDSGVSGSTINDNGSYIGGFVGQNVATGSVINGTVTSTTVEGANTVGGFVGTNAGSISGSSDTTNTTLGNYAIKGIGYVGGFAGSNVAGGTINTSSSSNTGSTAVDGTGSRIGGFVGWNAGSLTSDQASDAVNGVAQVGGFVGWNDGSVTGSTIQDATVTGMQYGLGGFVGYNTATGNIKTSGVTDATVGGIGGVGGFAGLSTGSLTTDSVAGSTVNDTTASTTGGFVAQNTGTITGGTVTSTVVDGANYTGGFVGTNSGSISGSTTSTTTSLGSYAVSGIGYVGGFAGSNAAGGTISTSSSSNTGTTAVYGSGTRVGGFVGWNAGSLTGDQSSDAVNGTQQLGGLVGWNDGSILDSSASGAATGTSVSVGGLVGYNTVTATINQSFATGTVMGTGYLGGLVGDNLGSITNAYAIGSVGVASDNNVGGLVGYNSGTIKDVYAAGTVVGKAGSTGALVGTNIATGHISNAYIDAVITGSLPAVGANLGTVQIVALGGTGEPDPTLQATYVGFDFTNVWTIAPDDMPTLLHAP